MRRTKVGVPQGNQNATNAAWPDRWTIREYVAAGHSVLVKTAAGAGIGATDVFASSEMIVKVKELPRLRVRTRFSTIDGVEDEVFVADVVTGAVLAPGASTPKLVNRSMLSPMRKGSAIVDRHRIIAADEPVGLIAQLGLQ